MTQAEAIESVLAGLQALIVSNLKGVAQEQYFPCSNPDDMDDRIAQGKQRATQLRAIRNDFENLITGVLP